MRFLLLYLIFYVMFLLALKFSLMFVSYIFDLCSLEWWSFELIILLSGLLPNPELETSVLSIWYAINLSPSDVNGFMCLKIGFEIVTCSQILNLIHSSDGNLLLTIFLTSLNITTTIYTIAESIGSAARF